VFKSCLKVNINWEGNILEYDPDFTGEIENVGQIKAFDIEIL
jgi:hypothetical protein